MSSPWEHLNVFVPIVYPPLREGVKYQQVIPWTAEYRQGYADGARLDFMLHSLECDYIKGFVSGIHDNYPVGYW